MHIQMRMMVEALEFEFEFVFSLFLFPRSKYSRDLPLCDSHLLDHPQVRDQLIYHRKKLFIFDTLDSYKHQGGPSIR